MQMCRRESMFTKRVYKATYKAAYKEQPNRCPNLVLIKPYKRPIMMHKRYKDHQPNVAISNLVYSEHGKCKYRCPTRRHKAIIPTEILTAKLSVDVIHLIPLLYNLLAIAPVFEQQQVMELDEVGVHIR
uniref:Uncharacterized protein n=1 Tax=Leersia perrieri TaxID=77586 RepID=A0A0D9WTN3_9ORYZ